jgi:ABC-type cobalamin/Fe3+-siderophores transport system ATPase subunit
LLCLNVTVHGSGSPRDVLTPAILEHVYGAPMDVLEHAGMPLVVDPPGEAGLMIPFREVQHAFPA